MFPEFYFDNCPVIGLEAKMSKIIFLGFSENFFFHIFYCPVKKLPVNKHLFNTLYHA